MFCPNWRFRQKIGSAVSVIVTLLLVVVILVHFASVGWANPYSKAEDSGTKEAPLGIKPANITILFPANNAKYNSNSISLNFSVNLGQRGISIDKIGFFGRWQKEIVYINFTEYNNTIPLIISVNITDIPEGNNSLTVYAVETGLLYTDFFHYYHFYVDAFSTIKFSIDLTSPTVIVDSVENATYFTPDVPLNFTVNEPTLRISYVLDGKEVSVTGNTTIQGLTKGSHTITICATDEAGNLGTSEPIIFTIAETSRFPETPVVAAIIAVVAIAIGSLLVFRRKLSLSRFI